MIESHVRFTIEVGRVNVKSLNFSSSSELYDAPVVGRIVPPAFPAAVKCAIWSELSFEAWRWLNGPQNWSTGPDTYL